MLPLAFTNSEDYVEVVRVGGNDEAKQHLSDLGFVPGAYVTVISSHGGDIIVNVKERNRRRASPCFALRPRRTAQKREG